MSPEEKAELQRDAQSLAYVAIRFSKLHQSLTNQQWDAKAARSLRRFCSETCRWKAWDKAHPRQGVKQTN